MKNLFGFVKRERNFRFAGTESDLYTFMSCMTYDSGITNVNISTLPSKDIGRMEVYFTFWANERNHEKLKNNLKERHFRIFNSSGYNGFGLTVQMKES